MKKYINKILDVILSPITIIVLLFLFPKIVVTVGFVYFYGLLFLLVIFFFSMIHKAIVSEEYKNQIIKIIVYILFMTGGIVFLFFWYINASNSTQIFLS